jgi:hypothetical protein
MDAVAEITSHAELISRLGSTLPVELDRLSLPQAMGMAASATNQITFRFAYRDVPFDGRAERRGNAAALHLSGDLGPLPFSAQGALRRRRALRTLAAASHATGLDWRLSPTQRITLAGETELPRPLTPAAMVSGAVGLLLRGERYLQLLLDVLGDAAYLDTPRRGLAALGAPGLSSLPAA